VEADQFSEAMEHFFRAMRRARTRWNSDLEAGGLTAAQFILLVPLLDGEERSVRQLAEGAAVSSPTATRMLDGLERDGMIERRPSQRDRRCVLVALTGAGRAALEAGRTAARTRRRAIYDRLEPAEREDAERILRRLAVVTDETP
jgi:DNA-binding MarR family transcriptional regulator